MNAFHVHTAGMFCSAMLLLTLTLLPKIWELRIAYPFWLNGTHPPECGYSAFHVMWIDGRANLEPYQIFDISYEDNSFRVIKPDISYGGICDTELNIMPPPTSASRPSALVRPTRSYSSSTTAPSSGHSRHHLRGRLSTARMDSPCRRPTRSHGLPERTSPTTIGVRCQGAAGCP